MQKGLSPLIAVILLIAFTITVAALVAAFSKTFVQDKTEEFEEQTQEIITECNLAGLKIEAASYDGDASTITSVVRNTRNQDLTDFEVLVFFTETNFTELKPTNSETNLVKGDLLSLAVTGVSEAPEFIEIRSGICPNDAKDKCDYSAGRFRC